MIDGEEGQQQGRLDGMGRKVSGIALMAGQQARRAAAQRARARVPCRERREEERGEREKKGQRFDSFQTQKFQWKLEKF